MPAALARSLVPDERPSRLVRIVQPLCDLMAQSSGSLSLSFLNGRGTHKRAATAAPIAPGAITAMTGGVDILSMRLREYEGKTLYIARFCRHDVRKEVEEGCIITANAEDVFLNLA
jgi:hypothetical protein